ncbi:MAG: hypothetical protein KF891_21015 [Rhizobacter sp.]|nr:hypothetical protein [Rhizobacter sp.]
MMWHWNSLWARAPGDPPTIADTVLWQSPWSAEALALQARTWEALLSATHSWWTTMLATWPAAAPWGTPLSKPGDAATAAEPMVARLPSPTEMKAATPRKRPSTARKAAPRKR